jgi:alpha-beta hydrolase superfamily lysophospholipase
MQQTKLMAALFATAILAGCGGGGSSGPTVSSDTQTRGTLVASPPNRVPIPQADGTYAATLPAAQFAQMLEAGQPGITQITGTPKCAISIYYMKYITVGGAGEATDATGAIMVPSGTDAACSGPRPVLLYAHGTETDKAFNMANIREYSEASLIAATFAAQGFIVVAPNYAGYDTSSLGYHPYLNAEQQANDMVDAMRAARKAFASIGATASSKLLVSGYSQGGHVSMATQRAMQTTYASEFQVTAFAGMSGPYAMSLFGDAIMAGSPPLGGTVFLPLVATSYQKSYGGLYSSTSDLYEAQYATGIESLLPSTMSLTDLFTSGKLPQTAVFAADSLPGPSSSAFSAFFGAGNLIKSSFRTTYLVDAQQNPCNTAAGAPVACNPANAIRKALLKNDLRTYVPTVPTMLCGGNADPMVFYVNTQATQAYFLGKGMPSAALTVLDVDSSPSSTSDPFAAVKVGFGQAKTATASAAVAAKTDPTQAVARAYHSNLVYPFCAAAARGYFQGVLAAQ